MGKAVNILGYIGIAFFISFLIFIGGYATGYELAQDNVKVCREARIEYIPINNTIVKEANCEEYEKILSDIKNIKRIKNELEDENGN